MTAYADFTAAYPTSAATQPQVEALLPHAEDLVAAHILAAYDPTDTDTAATLTAAVCHQVAAWIETGDSNDLAGYGATVTVKVAGLEIGGQPATLSPRAARALRAAGLLTPVGV